MPVTVTEPEPTVQDATTTASAASAALHRAQHRPSHAYDTSATGINLAILSLRETSAV